MNFKLMLLGSLLLASCTSLNSRTPTADKEPVYDLTLDKKNICGLIKSVNQESGWIELSIGKNLDEKRMIQVNDPTSKHAQEILDLNGENGFQANDFLLCESQAYNYDRTWTFKLNSTESLYTCNGFETKTIKDFSGISNKLDIAEENVEQIKALFTGDKTFQRVSSVTKSFLTIEKMKDDRVVAFIQEDPNIAITVNPEEKETALNYSGKNKAGQIDLSISNQMAQWPEASGKNLERLSPKPPVCDELCEKSVPMPKLDQNGWAYVRFSPKLRKSKSLSGHFICKKPLKKPTVTK